MLLQSSRLFTLLCAWVSFLAVIQALPLDLVTRNASTITESQKRSSELKVPVQMWIGHPDTPFEHWVLNIDKSNNFHTKKVSRNPKHPLKPSLYSKDYSSVNDPDWQYIDLDCEATFNSDSKMEDVFKDLVNIPWTSAPIDSGGNCLDYVKAALELLAEGNFISAVPSKFTDRYNKYYVEVTKTVWKVEVTLPQS